MTTLQKSQTASGKPVTYGSDQDTMWLEIDHGKGCRTAIYCARSRDAGMLLIRERIVEEGIKIHPQHSDLFLFPTFLSEHPDLTANVAETSKLTPDKDLVKEFRFLEHRDRAEEEFKRGVLADQDSKEGSTCELRAEISDQISAIQIYIRSIPCGLEDVAALSAGLRNNGANVACCEAIERMLFDLPRSGGNYQVRWAQQGLELIDRILKGFASDNDIVELMDWSQGAVEWTPYPAAVTPTEISEGVLSSLIAHT